MIDKSIIFVVNSDSQIFGAMHHAAQFISKGYHVTFLIFSHENIPGYLKSVVQDLYDVEQLSCSLASATDDVFHRMLDATCVGVFAAGSEIQNVIRFLVNMRRNTSRIRPFVFTGFNGFVYEKFEEGLAWRLGADVICLNSRDDLMLAKTRLTGTRYCDQPFAVTGVPANNVDLNHISPRRQKTLIFAEQLVVPRTRQERMFMVRQLVKLGVANREWQIIIRPRVQINERSFHKNEHPIEQIVDLVPGASKNLTISNQPLNDLLSDASGFCTISSTAIFSALRAGIPSFIFGDLGIRNELGTHMFMNSGLLKQTTNDDSIDSLICKTVCERWGTRNGLFAEDYDLLFRRISDFLNRPSDAPSQPVSEETFNKNILKNTTSNIDSRDDPEHRSYRSIADYGHDIAVDKYSFETNWRTLNWDRMLSIGEYLVSNSAISEKNLYTILWRRSLRDGKWKRALKFINKSLQQELTVFEHAILIGIQLPLPFRLIIKWLA